MSEQLRELWRNWWEGDIWIAPWSKALDGLTPEQAAWKPPGGRHSIWQLVNHVLYWRNITLRRVAGNAPPASFQPAHVEQFAEPATIDAQSWEAARAQILETHQRIQRCLDDPAVSVVLVRYHLPHDSYHLGQIMLLRALQGLPAVV